MQVIIIDVVMIICTGQECYSAAKDPLAAVWSPLLSPDSEAGFQHSPTGANQVNVGEAVSLPGGSERGDLRWVGAGGAISRTIAMGRPDLANGCCGFFSLTQGVYIVSGMDLMQGASS